MPLDRPTPRSDPVSGHIIEDRILATFAPEDLGIQGVLVGQMRAYR